jgi:hypothetical protein
VTALTATTGEEDGRHRELRSPATLRERRVLNERFVAQQEGSLETLEMM